MISLDTIVKFCDEYLNVQNFKDFKRAYNGLEFENNGTISKIGSAVDFNLLIVEKAIEQKVDFLVVHHGMFWGPTAPVIGTLYRKYKLLLDNNIAVYSSHLPLDEHQEIGNNVLLAKALDLAIEKHEVMDPEFEFDMPICSTRLTIQDLSIKISTVFPGTKSILFGPDQPKQISICTGSIGDSIYELPKYGIDTLITGEIDQHMFGFAYENKLNIFVCGHYATEISGVQNLGKIISKKFHIPEIFLSENCEF